MKANILSLFDETSNRLEHVYLKYREVGTNAWNIAKVLDNNQLLNADYAQEGIEDNYGYATLNWAFEASQLKDGDYEVIAQSVCKPIPNSPAEYNSFSTSIIEGTVDREIPSVYGLTSIEQNNNVLDVDQEVIINFSEDILCSKPYKFSIAINSEANLDEDDLQIKCLKDIINFHIKKSSSSTLAGKRASLIISGVQDLVGNTMSKSFKVDFSFSQSNGRRLEDDYGNITEHMGCDGVDQNSDGVIDDCEEDNVPPSLSIESLPLFSNPRFPQIPFLKNPVFSTINDAKDFLLKHLVAYDDCATELDLNVSSPFASCDGTLFEATVTDTRCGTINPTQTLTKSFLLHVDDEAPVLSVGFHPSSKTLLHQGNKQILFVQESDESFVNVLYSYKIEDNCPQKLKVNVSIKSNENSSENTMTMIRKKGSKFQFYIEPSSCKTKDEMENYFCEWNPDIPFRFYEIHLNVVDYGGNVATTIATVVIVPKTKADTHGALSNEKYFESMIAKEHDLYDLASDTMELEV